MDPICGHECCSGHSPVTMPIAEVNVRRMDRRDGVAMWRVAHEQRRSFCGPFSFVALARRYATTSAVLVAEDEVIGYLLARRQGEALRIVDFEVLAGGLHGAVLWELLDAVVGPQQNVSYVEIPSAIDDRICRVFAAAHPLPRAGLVTAARALAPRNVIAGDALTLAKTSPTSPFAGRSLGATSSSAQLRALA